MKDIQNDKGFLVMEVSREELMNALGEYTEGVCDYCLSSPENGYYVAVLNQWFCKECYDKWYKSATNYPEDRGCEIRNYVKYKEFFKDGIHIH